MGAMTDRSPVAARFAKVAAGFSQRVDAVPADAWERPAPCEGWVARDVVRHLVTWVPGLVAVGSGEVIAPGPDVDADPAGAWEHLRSSLQAILDDPERSVKPFRHPQAGDHRLDEAIGQFVLGDVLVHTWDLARATGLDERLDPEEVHGMLVGLEPMGDALAKSGHYGSPVPVGPDADDQTRLIAFTGRTP
jgi:uncharacterized protein (TIGR03086 family)